VGPGTEVGPCPEEPELLAGAGEELGDGGAGAFEREGFGLVGVIGAVGEGDGFGEFPFAGVGGFAGRIDKDEPGGAAVFDLVAALDAVAGEFGLFVVIEPIGDFGFGADGAGAGAEEAKGELFGAGGDAEGAVSVEADGGDAVFGEALDFPVADAGKELGLDLGVRRRGGEQQGTQKGHCDIFELQHPNL